MKCTAPSTEAAADALLAVIDLAYGYPKRGTQASPGLHATIAPSWNGTGECPPGWTAHQEQIWVASAADAIVTLSDSTSTFAASSSLSGPQKAQIATASAGRSDIPNPASGRTPKAEAVQATAEKAS